LTYNFSQLSLVSIIGGHEADLVGDLLAEGVGGEDLDEVALAEDGEAEVGGGMTLEVEEAGVVVEGRLVLRGVERGEAEVVAGSVTHAQGDGGGQSLLVIDAEGVGEVLCRVEVRRDAEGLVGQELHVLEAVEGEGLDYRLVVLLGEEVPAAFVGLEQIGAHVALVWLGAELVVGGLEAALGAECLDDEVEVLHAPGGLGQEDALADLLRLLVERGVGEAGEQPLGELGVFGEVDVVGAGAAVAVDGDVEQVEAIVAIVVEGAAGQCVAAAEGGVALPMFADLG